MHWLDVKGQPRAMRMLQMARAGSRMPHGWIFYGPAGVGKEMLAVRFARLILCEQPVTIDPPAEAHAEGPWHDGCGRCRSCHIIESGTHPDLHLVYRQLNKHHPDSTVQNRKALDISVDVIRHFLLDPVRGRSAMGRAKVYIVREAELLSTAAQNAMLKTLEEPPEDTYIILLSTARDRLLPTTLSRCQSVGFGQLDLPTTQQIIAARGMAPADASFYAALSEGRPGGALHLAKMDLRADYAGIARDLAGIGAADPMQVAAGWQEITQRWAKAIQDDDSDADPTTDQNRQALQVLFVVLSTILRDALRLGQRPPASPCWRRAPNPCRNWPVGAANRLAAGIRQVAWAESAIARNANTVLTLEALAVKLAQCSRGVLTSLLDAGMQRAGRPDTRSQYCRNRLMTQQAEPVQDKPQPPKPLIAVRYGYLGWVGRVPARPGAETHSGPTTSSSRPSAAWRSACPLPPPVPRSAPSASGPSSRTLTSGPAARTICSAAPARWSASPRPRTSPSSAASTAAPRTRWISASGPPSKVGLDMRMIACEHLLGGERIIFYFTAEGRIDFRQLVRDLAREYHTRIEMRQIGARDEARIVADFEICGRECCCKNFLKVLRPVNMKMAKLQKATLDPTKVSGRCGRLRCCLRYEQADLRGTRCQACPSFGVRVRVEQGIGYHPRSPGDHPDRRARHGRGAPPGRAARGDPGDPAAWRARRDRPAQRPRAGARLAPRPAGTAMRRCRRAPRDENARDARGRRARCPSRQMAIPAVAAAPRSRRRPRGRQWSPPAPAAGSPRSARRFPPAGRGPW